MALKIIPTQDGSPTVLNGNLNASYHSTFGAINESEHIYINNGLRSAVQTFGKSLTLLEIGFGTGLNTLLTLKESLNAGYQINYFALEKFPLGKEIYDVLDYPALVKGINHQYFKLMHEAAWSRSVKLSDTFYLHKFNEDALHFNFTVKYHLIYFDAFAPVHTPELWSEQLFEKLFNSLHHKGIFITFCAKGVVKRALKQTGFTVETLKGPPGKREIIRAVKP